MNTTKQNKPKEKIVQAPPQSYNTPHPPRDPPENYAPTKFSHNAFDVTNIMPFSIYRPFVSPDEKLGPGANKNEEYKLCEYFAYHRYSFYQIQAQTLVIRSLRLEAEKVLRSVGETDSETDSNSSGSDTDPSSDDDCCRDISHKVPTKIQCAESRPEKSAPKSMFDVQPKLHGDTETLIQGMRNKQTVPIIMPGAVAQIRSTAHVTDNDAIKCESVPVSKQTKTKPPIQRPNTKAKQKINIPTEDVEVKPFKAIKEIKHSIDDTAFTESAKIGMTSKSKSTSHLAKIASTLDIPIKEDKKPKITILKGDEIADYLKEQKQMKVKSSKSPRKFVGSVGAIVNEPISNVKEMLTTSNLSDDKSKDDDVILLDSAEVGKKMEKIVKAAITRVQKDSSDGLEPTTETTIYADPFESIIQQSNSKIFSDRMESSELSSDVTVKIVESKVESKVNETLMKEQSSSKAKKIESIPQKNTIETILMKETTELDEKLKAIANETIMKMHKEAMQTPSSDKEVIMLERPTSITITEDLKKTENINEITRMESELDKKMEFITNDHVETQYIDLDVQTIAPSVTPTTEIPKVDKEKMQIIVVKDKKELDNKLESFAETALLNASKETMQTESKSVSDVEIKFLKAPTEITITGEPKVSKLIKETNNVKSISLNESKELGEKLDSIAQLALSKAQEKNRTLPNKSTDSDMKLFVPSTKFTTSKEPIQKEMASDSLKSSKEIDEKFESITQKAVVKDVIDTLNESLSKKLESTAAKLSKEDDLHRKLSVTALETQIAIKKETPMMVIDSVKPLELKKQIDVATEEKSTKTSVKHSFNDFDEPYRSLSQMKLIEAAKGSKISKTTVEEKLCENANDRKLSECNVMVITDHFVSGKGSTPIQSDENTFENKLMKQDSEMKISLPINTSKTVEVLKEVCVFDKLSGAECFEIKEDNIKLIPSTEIPVKQHKVKVKQPVEHFQKQEQKMSIKIILQPLSGVKQSSEHTVATTVEMQPKHSIELSKEESKVLALKTLLPTEIQPVSRKTKSKAITKKIKKIGSLKTVIDSTLSKRMPSETVTPKIDINPQPISDESRGIARDMLIPQRKPTENIESLKKSIQTIKIVRDDTTTTETVKKTKHPDGDSVKGITPKIAAPTTSGVLLDLNALQRLKPNSEKVRIRNERLKLKSKLPKDLVLYGAPKDPETVHKKPSTSQKFDNKTILKPLIAYGRKGVALPKVVEPEELKLFDTNQPTNQTTNQKKQMASLASTKNIVYNKNKEGIKRKTKTGEKLLKPNSNSIDDPKKFSSLTDQDDGNKTDKNNIDTKQSRVERVKKVGAFTSHPLLKMKGKEKQKPVEIQMEIVNKPKCEYKTTDLDGIIQTYQTTQLTEYKKHDLITLKKTETQLLIPQQDSKTLLEEDMDTKVHVQQNVEESVKSQEPNANIVTKPIVHMVKYDPRTKRVCKHMREIEQEKVANSKTDTTKVESNVIESIATKEVTNDDMNDSSHRDIEIINEIKSNEEKKVEMKEPIAKMHRPILVSATQQACAQANLKPKDTSNLQLDDSNVKAIDDLVKSQDRPSIDAFKQQALQKYVLKKLKTHNILKAVSEMLCTHNTRAAVSAIPESEKVNNNKNVSDMTIPVKKVKSDDILSAPSKTTIEHAVKAKQKQNLDSKNTKVSVLPASDKVDAKRNVLPTSKRVKEVKSDYILSAPPKRINKEGLDAKQKKLGSWHTNDTSALDTVDIKKNVLNTTKPVKKVKSDYILSASSKTMSKQGLDAKQKNLGSWHTNASDTLELESVDTKKNVLDTSMKKVKSDYILGTHAKTILKQGLDGKQKNLGKSISTTKMVGDHATTETRGLEKLKAKVKKVLIETVISNKNVKEPTTKKVKSSAKEVELQTSDPKRPNIVNMTKMEMQKKVTNMSTKVKKLKVAKKIDIINVAKPVELEKDIKASVRKVILDDAIQVQKPTMSRNTMIVNKCVLDNVIQVQKKKEKNVTATKTDPLISVPKQLSTSKGQIICSRKFILDDNVQPVEIREDKRIIISQSNNDCNDNSSHPSSDNSGQSNKSDQKSTNTSDSSNTSSSTCKIQKRKPIVTCPKDKK